jgi:Tat protein secretion system quality control protein TatD with DNase activity
MHLFDAHCHLQDPRLNPDLEGVLKRAVGTGIDGLMSCGTCESD